MRSILNRVIVENLFCIVASVGVCGAAIVSDFLNTSTVTTYYGARAMHVMFCNIYLGLFYITFGAEENEAERDMTFQVSPVKEKLKENRLRWFGHVMHSYMAIAIGTEKY